MGEPRDEHDSLDSATMELALLIADVDPDAVEEVLSQREAARLTEGRAAR